MVMTVTPRPGALAAAVNNFSTAYHRDYSLVRPLATRYLSAPPSNGTTGPLARALSAVLKRWGAGKRHAPACLPDPVMEATLKDPKLHSNLGALQSCSPHLALAGGKRIVISGGPFSNVAEFDKCLMGTLNLLSIGLLLANTNVTYPMKSLLLLTGLMPAFDSQVRNGLAVAGVSGINNTQYLLPALGSTNAKKICAIPFYISDCVSRQAGIINTETSASMYPSLATEHGRVFDVLLFMQSDRTHLTVTFSPGATKRWYAI